MQSGGSEKVAEVHVIFPAIENGFRNLKFAAEQPFTLYERVSGSSKFCALPASEFGRTGWPRRVRRIGFQRGEAGALDPHAVLRAPHRCGASFFDGIQRGKTAISG